MYISILYYIMSYIYIGTSKIVDSITKCLWLYQLWIPNMKTPNPYVMMWVCENDWRICGESGELVESVQIKDVSGHFEETDLKSRRAPSQKMKAIQHHLFRWNLTKAIGCSSGAGRTRRFQAPGGVHRSFHTIPEVSCYRMKWALVFSEWPRDFARYQSTRIRG